MASADVEMYSPTTVDQPAASSASMNTRMSTGSVPHRRTSTDTHMSSVTDEDVGGIQSRFTPSDVDAAIRVLSVVARSLRRSKRSMRRPLPRDIEQQIRDSGTPVTLEHGETNVRGTIPARRGQTIIHEPTPVQEQKLKPVFTNRLAFMSVIWQVINVAILYGMTSSLKGESRQSENRHEGAAVPVIIMALFQLAHLALICVVSIKLTKQVLHRTVTMGFLFQSWISTVIMFAGIYLLLDFWDDRNFIDLVKEPEANQGGYEPVTEYNIFRRFVRFVYFSIELMSTVGLGDLVGATVLAEIVTSFQMLLSTVYTAVIFAKGISHFNDEEDLIDDDGEYADASQYSNNTLTASHGPHEQKGVWGTVKGWGNKALNAFGLFATGVSGSQAAQERLLVNRYRKSSIGGSGSGNAKHQPVIGGSQNQSINADSAPRPQR